MGGEGGEGQEVGAAILVLERGGGEVESPWLVAGLERGERGAEAVDWPLTVICKAGRARVPPAGWLWASFGEWLVVVVFGCCG